MNEILPGIFLITEQGLFPSLKPPANIYVLAGKDGLVFDSGYGNSSSIKQFAREMEKIKEYCRSNNIDFNINRILPSHSHVDHFSGLYRLRKLFGYSVILTTRMKEVLASRENYRRYYSSFFTDDEFTKPGIKTLAGKLVEPVMSFYYKKTFGITFLKDPDIVIESHGMITINGENWEIFHSPGHCEDHISLYNPDKGVLLGGDNILIGITTWLGPPRSDLMDYIHTLENILKLPKLEIILGSHGSPVTEPQKRIREIIDWRMKRTEQVHSVILKFGKNGITKKDVLKKIYSRGGIIKMFLAEGWVDLTLGYLLRANLVQKEVIKNRVFYMPM